MKIMSTQIQTLKGFRDFLGSEASKRLWLIENIRKVFEKFGYESLETPTLEYEALLMGKYGTEADKLIYSFEDRGQRRVALRYDQTIPLARIVSQYQNELVFPYKRYQIQPVWRADKPQKGRYREFLQCDADIVGTNSPSADAEMLVLYAAIYEQIGLNSLKIKLNDREVLFQTIKEAGVEETAVFSVIQTLDKLDKKSKEEVIQELTEKGVSSGAATDLLSKLEQAEMPEKLSKIVNLAEQMGAKKDIFLFSPTLARGLDYYTGMIFEGVIPEYTVGSVGGGGRYDNLLNQLLGVDQPAVGFAVGFDRTLEAAEQLGKIPAESRGTKVLVTIFSPDLAKNSMSVTAELRKQGIPAELYLDPDRKLDAQLKYANKKAIPFVIIIGPDEVANNTIKLKNMKTGEQKEVKKEELQQNLT
jgi:histidyl-tRNA synthetase